MAIAFSTNPTLPKLYQSCTVSMTGGAAATHYTMLITHPGGEIQTIPLLTDGSGNASFKYTPYSSGSCSFTLNTVVAVASSATTPHSS